MGRARISVPLLLLLGCAHSPPPPSSQVSLRATSGPVTRPRPITRPIDRDGDRVVHEVRAVADTAHRRHPQARTIVELGGQDAKLILFADGTSDDAQMNDRCAAGTGATLDRIARRLELTPEEMQTPHSVLLCPETRFHIYMPPKRLE